MSSNILKKLPKIKPLTIKEFFNKGSVWKTKVDLLETPTRNFIIPAGSMAAICEVEINEEWPEEAIIGIVFNSEVYDDELKDITPEVTACLISRKYTIKTFIESFERCNIEVTNENN